MRRIFIYLLLLRTISSSAQVDSMPILSLDSFLSKVRNHHPIAMQAEMQLNRGEANLQGARGAFDPKIGASMAQKYFDNQEYYDLGNAQFKIPTWFGIELEAGHERNDGQFLNPENNVPNNGLWFAGISVPIGQGLFIDERRAELRKAQSMLEQTQAERDLMMNELLFDAGLIYWDWFVAYHNLEVYQNAFVLAQERFNAVKQSAILGDVPFIDTLEAGIQVQNRILNLEEAKLQLKNVRALLAIYLWQDGFIPLELSENVVPSSREDIGDDEFQIQLGLMADSMVSMHPELRRRKAMIDQLNIEERWSKEQLKPSLNLKYQPITEAFDQSPFADYSLNNYTWGFQFEFPIFLRKERAKLNLVQLKITENQLKLENKREVQSFKVVAALNEFETTQGQIVLYTKTTEDYSGLLDGERRLFNNGESSLFLVNSRELGYINAQIKLIELLAKNQKSKLKLDYALGKLN